ncbi:hypothetical protein RSAG8_10203, partial [Rhizoctonia solani AG-8 WAC10335]
MVRKRSVPCLPLLVSLIQLVGKGPGSSGEVGSGDASGREAEQGAAHENFRSFERTAWAVEAEYATTKKTHGG